MALLGVYVDNSAQAVYQFESWLGRKVDGIHGVIGSANWSDFVTSAQWSVETLWAPTGRDVFWSVPLIVNGANLYSAANGDYNQYYRQVAQELLKYDTSSDPIYVRTGWEFNGSWFQWSANGKETAFVGAFQEFVDTFRSVSDRFKFEWNVNESYGGMDPSKAYPGDNYVDIIGMDFYYNPQYQGTDAAKAWNQLLTEKYGLQWLENFADAHGKPTAYSEWGVTGNNAAEFVKLAEAWFESHDVVYQSVWNSDIAYAGKLSDGSDPATGAAFKAAFNTGSSTNVDWDTPAVPETAPSTGSGSDSANGGDSGTGTPVSYVPPASGASAAQASAAWTKQSWGSSSADTWYGTGGNDWHQSNGGGDTLYGGAGDDTYSIFTASDRVVEQSGGGRDTVTTWVHDYALPDNVENLTFYGWGNSKGTGNGLDNIIIGNDGANVLNGMYGRDVLTGKAGADTFVIGKLQGHDRVTDFSHAQGDKIVLQGFGNGASLTHDGDVWAIRAADGSVTHLTLSGVTSLASNDYSWA